ncbi:N-acetylmuramoyl-L-alanine amidase [Tissierella sp.]|uniref:N-acetylmuramoyl-L-alanine amidase family protein n=1 Tax=Tissierella sp. TaxID=41274 RepID=UPI0030332E8D
MYKIFIDAGHGGKDSGAVGNRLQEKDINLSVALKVGEILKRHNVEVIYSRTTDVFVELADRASIANKANADIFVSIHSNAADNIAAKGLETFSYPNSAKGTDLAKCIQDSILQSKIYTSNRGIKTANFAVLRQSNMPSALVELAFITNVEDSKILRDKQNELALSVAKGILDYLKINYIEETKETNKYSPWAREGMLWGIDLGLTDGSNPKEPITLERVITILHRMSKIK